MDIMYDTEMLDMNKDSRLKSAYLNFIGRLTPEERKSPRMKEAFAYERTARHRLMQARGVTLKNLWAAVVCAASACSYLDLCRKRAERRQKTT